MDFMPLVPFLFVSVPESLILYYMVLVLVRKKAPTLLIVALSLLTSLFSFAVRSASMAFGIHSIIQIIVMVIFLILFFKLPWQAAIVAMAMVSMALGLAEGIFVPLLIRLFSLEPGQIFSNPIMRILFTVPHLLFLAILTYIISKAQWRLSLITQLMQLDSGTAKETKKQLSSQMRLFALPLVQALMLALLNISFYIYTSDIYPSFTLDTLVNISRIVLLVAALATIFIAGYLSRIIEQEAKLEIELRHVKERHNLNLRLQVERHDFYNHLTAIYGYIKAGHYAQAETYVENLYQTVRHIGSLLKIEPPELAAILDVKQKEAETREVEFQWEVRIENNTIPLSPEGLTHLIGNLLDNALEAAEGSCTPKVDLVLTCNNLGLTLRVSNNGNTIYQDIRHSIFAAGYTTKDTNRHNGLGLYIIKQIVDRYDGHLELKEPGNYPGVEFDIYIPWSN